MSTSSVFLAPDQPGANPQAQSNQHSTPLYSAGDAAKAIGSSITTIKRIATELRLDVRQTVGGIWLFSDDQITKTKSEIERRQREALK